MSNNSISNETLLVQAATENELTPEQIKVSKLKNGEVVKSSDY